MSEEFQYEYDVVFSFAGAQRDYVESVKNSLKKYGVSVFYDNDNSVDLWGKNLYRYLDCLYSKKARYCVMFISKEYGKRPWTIHESQSAQERMFNSYDSMNFQEYILPVKFDNTQIPGIRTTTGFMDANKLTPDELAAKIAEKLRKRDHATPVSSVIQNFFEDLSSIMESSIVNSRYMQYEREGNFAQIIEINTRKTLLSIRLYENHITIEFGEGTAGYNPTILIFFNHGNKNLPVKIINFSNHLFQKPEQDMTIDDLKSLLSDNFLNILEEQSDIISKSL